MKLEKTFAGRRVLVTGHTGFKGSWLSLWLHSLGADVVGFSVDVPTKPSHFAAAGFRIVCAGRDGRLAARDLRPS